MRFWTTGRRDFEQLLTAYKAKMGIVDIEPATPSDMDQLYKMAGEVIRKRALK